MPEQTLVDDPAAIGALKGLLDLTRTADEAGPRRLLEAAGEAIATSTGFGLVAVNVYRPEYDDYAPTFVHGRPDLCSPESSPPPIPPNWQSLAYWPHAVINRSVPRRRPACWLAIPRAINGVAACHPCGLPRSVLPKPAGSKFCAKAGRFRRKRRAG